MKLFRVYIKAPVDYYVIAEGMDEAYQKVLDYLNKEDIYFVSYRKLDKVELIADEKESGYYKKLFL